MVYPTVHLNGTSREELQRQIREAHDAVAKALDVLGKAAPHARDYYPQSKMAICEAQAEHRLRMTRLEVTMRELYDIWERIA